MCRAMHRNSVARPRRPKPQVGTPPSVEHHLLKRRLIAEDNRIRREQGGGACSTILSRLGHVHAAAMKKDRRGTIVVPVLFDPLRVRLHASPASRRVHLLRALRRRRRRRPAVLLLLLLLWRWRRRRCRQARRGGRGGVVSLYLRRPSRGSRVRRGGGCAALVGSASSVTGGGCAALVGSASSVTATRLLSDSCTRALLYGEGKVANRETGVWHGATENRSLNDGRIQNPSNTFGTAI